MQKENPHTTEIGIPESIIPADEAGEKVVELPGRAVMLPQLQRLRRQFIALNRRHDIAVDRAGVLFVEFLNGALRE
jgi:tRNA uridine 5-carbamoylmethylation protein Kti12